ncbi:hypothetical protein [Halomonas colorata]|uniref:hypothetical protein n=1 Tax=Halomonas colorata TaxID=2742615 RepID=UPI0018664F19|nr:hypothetical protein [Halomonas colorata]
MAKLQHCISPENQQELRAGRVVWSDDGSQARCGHFHGHIQWSENRIGWHTNEREEIKWIDTKMGIVPQGVVKRYEEIARSEATESLKRLAAEVVRDVLDNADYEYKHASVETVLNKKPEDH